MGWGMEVLTNENTFIANVGLGNIFKMRKIWSKNMVCSFCYNEQMCMYFFLLIQCHGQRQRRSGKWTFCLVWLRDGKYHRLYCIMNLWRLHGYAVKTFMLSRVVPSALRIFNSRLWLCIGDPWCDKLVSEIHWRSQEVFHLYQWSGTTLVLNEKLLVIFNGFQIPTYQSMGPRYRIIHYFLSF